MNDVHQMKTVDFLKKKVREECSCLTTTCTSLLRRGCARKGVLIKD